MRLVALGGLQLDGVSFNRVKPLLLLTYLALEGPQERRYLAELFWPLASNPLNSLSVALMRLRKVVPGSLEADDTRAWTGVATDVGELNARLNEGDFEATRRLYGGPFVHGVTNDWGVELEEWVYAKREDCAARVQRALLKLAESEAAQGRFEAAAQRAEAGFTLDFAPEPEPEDLGRFYTLLQAGESPLASRVKEEAESFDIALGLSAAEARARLQRTLLGRTEEQELLRSLAPGEWAWVQGRAGMGKTTLLKSLSPQFLPGRSGLPFATVAPLVGRALQEGEGGVLYKLREIQGTLAIDNWELVDAESRRVLQKLYEVGSAARVVVSSRQNPPFKLDTRVELGPLSREDLSTVPGAWEKTQGLPAFVDAFLREDSLSLVLEDKLEALSPLACQVYFALTLLDAPDPAAVRRALRLSATEAAEALEDLLRRGFIEPSGQVRVRQAAQEYLSTRPTLHGPLALQLARVLEPERAFPLYQAARHLWRDEDEPRAVEAYLAWAGELLERGFPQRAVEVLNDAPVERPVTFLKSRALERAGRYQEAFAAAVPLAETPGVLALRATLYWRLGRPEEARVAAEAALKGEMFPRAEGFNVLGHLDLSAGKPETAMQFFRRASALWLALGENTRWALTLNNLAIARVQLGESVEAAFEEALTAASQNLTAQALVKTNVGQEYNRQEDWEKARSVFEEVIKLANETGDIMVASAAWNNLGFCFEQQQSNQARQAYRKALDLAQRAGHQFMVAGALSNLAELEGDAEAWEEAMRLFEATGNHAIVEQKRARIPLDHPVRRRSGQPH